ncbi:hypothetical protein SAMN05443529_13535 [Desulfosporosinus hippei DSM 8344]|uniref:Uncharacterized protein n=1 Tax=Desulfosporosinus hippei DSM 8344 TaxID=1121419 RepID=A0A1G8K1L1_9FIRM|nr:hypothetical protein SAMN05443529_13535 [Desulfosporosinus hippei DSM 8344]
MNSKGFIVWYKELQMLNINSNKEFLHYHYKETRLLRNLILLPLW